MKRYFDSTRTLGVMAVLSIGLVGCGGGNRGIDEGIDAGDMGPVGRPYDVEGLIKANGYAESDDLGPPADAPSPVDSPAIAPAEPNSSPLEETP